MSAEIEKRVKELGYDIPVAAAPAANYLPFVISGNVLHISGQLPMLDGKLAVSGHVGKDVDVAIKIDPSLIGGLVVKMGSRMVDASLKTKLNSIRLAMKEVG